MRGVYVLPEGEVGAAPAHAVFLIPLVDQPVLLFEQRDELDVFVEREDEALLVPVLAVVVPRLRSEGPEDLALLAEDEERREGVHRQDVSEARRARHVLGLFEVPNQRDRWDFCVGHQVHQCVLAC